MQHILQDCECGPSLSKRDLYDANQEALDWLEHQTSIGPLAAFRRYVVMGPAPAYLNYRYGGAESDHITGQLPSGSTPPQREEDIPITKRRRTQTSGPMLFWTAWLDRSYRNVCKSPSDTNITKIRDIRSLMEDREGWSLVRAGTRPKRERGLTSTLGCDRDGSIPITKRSITTEAVGNMSSPFKGCRVDYV
ncbi:hypothetical protein Bbelb_023430 [Branchiostoma belcheri]|nr:hypothetical protein Bbelb_023430 [Branchiostoma belcheri]